MKKNTRRRREDNGAAGTADLIEVFSSYQGEGLFVGAKQIFVRFAGCNMDCSYCDTRREAAIKGATVEELLKSIFKLEKDEGRHHSVSLTGGEPLLHAGFLEYLLPRLKKNGFKIYLETNGTLSQELERVIEYIDIIAMDIKLPSSTGMRPYWAEHADFMAVSRKKDLFIKIVVTEKTEERDVVRARDLVVKYDLNMPVVIQPATVDDKGTTKVSKKMLLRFLDLSEERLNNVRVIPQVQKFLSIK